MFQLRLHSMGTLEAAFFLPSKLLKIFHSLWQNQLNIFLPLGPRGIVFFAAKTACPCKRDESKLGQSCDITPTSWHHPLPRSLHDWCWSYISGCDDTQQIAKWMWAFNTRERYPISNGEQGTKNAVNIHLFSKSCDSFQYNNHLLVHFKSLINSKRWIVKLVSHSYCFAFKFYQQPFKDLNSKPFESFQL